MSETITKKTPPQSHKGQFYIVGVGASAGGLEAIENFFGALPDDTNMAFVVVQHLSPDFKSHMQELLSRKTKMNIHRVENGMAVEPNSVYLIPPKMEMIISERKLLLTERSPDRALSHPIDQFFRSLAADAGRFSISIVLSGTGSDGSRGIRDVHEAGGLVIAQDGHSAKFDGMPMNAQATGIVDVVVPPDAIAEVIVRYAKDGLSPEEVAKQELLASAEKGIDRVFQLLNQQHGLDFSYYKSSTVGRRIQRRIDLLRLGSLKDYLERIEGDPEELNDLYKDLLIGVTRFFRDNEAFEALKNEIIPKLFRKKDNEEVPIRVWVAGCATGEEAYSVAILLEEERRRRNSNVEIKIFATDPHHVSLHKAAAGVFPEESISEMPVEFKSRYFTKFRDGYHVVSEIRKLVIFAPHNVLSDAPFTQMDLVTCRNMLIYLQPIAQKKAISMFHFAVKASGYMFLGPSESPVDLAEEFDPINKRWRIFQKRRDIRLPIEASMRMGVGGALARKAKFNASGGSVDKKAAEKSIEGLFERLLDRKMPPSIMVDRNYDILHIFGGAQKYLTVPGGRQTSNVVASIAESLRTPLTGALQHAVRKQDVVCYAGLQLEINNKVVNLKLSVEPINQVGSGGDGLLIEIEPTEAPPAKANLIEQVNVTALSASRIATLESELRYSQENLQATVEEMETANEELQSTNEELTAANEELQSTNEELHSVNEELFTVNAEHQRRVDELQLANDDMDNLLATTRVGVIFLDEELFIRRFTPEVARLFHLVPQDIGRSIGGFVHHLNYEHMVKDLNDVFQTQKEKEVDIVDKQGKPFLLRMLPYRSGTDVSGVVLTLIDVERLYNVQQDMARFRHATDAALDAIAIADKDGIFKYNNPSMCRTLGYKSEELQQLSVWDVNASIDKRSYQKLFEKTGKEEMKPFESEWMRKDGTTLPVEISVSSLQLEDHRYMCAIMRDISERVESRQLLRTQLKAIEAADAGIQIIDATKDNAVTFANEGFCRLSGYTKDELIGRSYQFMEGEDTSAESVKLLKNAIDKKEACRVEIINYRKDGTPFWNDMMISPVFDEAGELTNFVTVQDDVTEKKRHNKELTDARARVEGIIEATTDGFLFFDNDLKGQYINENACRMLALSRGKIIGKPLKKIFTDDVSVDFESKFRKSIETKESVKIEAYYKALDSWFEFRCFPTDDGLSVFFLDTTEKRQINSELKQVQLDLIDSEQRANQANQAKSEFLANMSHEIRTPMSAIIGFTDILSNHLKNPDDLNCTKIIRRNSQFLLDIINDILDISKIEAGRVELNFEEVLLDEFVGDLMSSMRVRADDRNVKLTSKVVGKIPRRVITDDKRLRQILVNLIGNAIKFTENGSVELVIEHSRTKKQDMLVFKVVDTGIGIAEANIGRLFEPFTQADASVDRDFEGTGLGLTISDRLARMLGGQIEVESKLGKGSTFTTNIAVKVKNKSDLIDTKAIDEANWKLPNETTDPLPQISGKILVVDDRREVRFIAQHFIEDAGGKVITADDGRKAIEEIKKAGSDGEPFDVIVMDVQMPVLDGLSAVRQLRSDGFKKPVIALTAHAMEGDRETCLEAGFTDYTPKPLDKQYFLSLLKKYCD